MISTTSGQSMNDDLSLNWARMYEITATIATQSASSQESVHTMAESVKYRQLLDSLRHDRYVGDKCYLGMFRAPGSVNRHHNVEGGLVKHLLQMWEIWLSFKGILRAHNAHHPLLNDGMIWKCILHHDLNKVWRYVHVRNDVWTVELAEDPLTSMLGGTNKALYFLNQQGIQLPVCLFNALLTAEGGFSKPYPKAESVLAKVAYLLDDMSANVVDRLQTNRFWDSKDGGINVVP